VYCAKCKRLFENERCPICGNRKVIHPAPEDICYLTEVDSIWSGMLAESLKQNEIPALYNSTIGAGMAMRAGSMFERVIFYVRFEHLSKGNEIVNELFHASEVSCSDE